MLRYNPALSHSARSYIFCQDASKLYVSKAQTTVPLLRVLKIGLYIHNTFLGIKQIFEGFKFHSLQRLKNFAYHLRVSIQDSQLLLRTFPSLITLHIGPEIEVDVLDLFQALDLYFFKLDTLILNCTDHRPFNEMGGRVLMLRDVISFVRDCLVVGGPVEHFRLLAQTEDFKLGWSRMYRRG